LIQEISKYVFLLGAVQGLFLSLFIFRKKENHSANLLLAFLIFAFSLDLGHAFIVASKLYIYAPHLLGITIGFPYLYGPLIYIYVKIIGSENKEFKKKYWLHFIPYLIVLIAVFIFFFFEDAAFKIGLFERKFKMFAAQLTSMFIPFHGIIYTYFSIREVSIFNRKIKYSYSNIDKINLNWLAYLAFGALIIWLIVVISYIVQAIFGHSNIGGYAIYFGVSVLVYIIGYKSLTQPEVYIIESVKADIHKPVETLKSYKKSGLSEDKADEYLQKLVTLFETEKIYRNSNLTLGELSKSIDISQHNLSEIINTKLNKTFYDYVNQYRVEEVQIKIIDGESEKYNLLSIAFDAGFNSKSSFNSIFKKYTGKTPTEFKSSLL
jgi:AraC-like DNA-binding protein